MLTQVTLRFAVGAGFGKMERRTWRLNADVYVGLVGTIEARFSRRFAAAHRGRTHVYDFGWRSTAYDGALGACHAIELPFVFNTLATVAGPRGLAGENPPQALADHMNQLWIAFATSGTVPWAEYSAENRRVYHPETGETSAELPMPAEHFLS